MERIEVDPSSLQRVARDLTASVAVAHEVKKHHAEWPGTPKTRARDCAVCGGVFLNRWSYGCGCWPPMPTVWRRTAEGRRYYLHNDKEAAWHRRLSCVPAPIRPPGAGDPDALDELAARSAYCPRMGEARTGSAQLAREIGSGTAKCVPRADR